MLKQTRGPRARRIFSGAGPRPRQIQSLLNRAYLLLVAAGGVAAVGTSGCALRATTDFGGQSATSRQSLTAGPEGLRGLPILGGDGADAGDVSRAGGPGVGGSPFSSDGGAVGSGGGH